MKKQTAIKTTVEVSARHLHITKEDLRQLFGKDGLEIRNFLSQSGEFAAKETIEVVGPDARFPKVRILGPIREYTQLEVSRSDAIYLGIDPPLAMSGEGHGATIKLVGPKDEVLKDVAIVPKRHIHLNSQLARQLKLATGDSVSVYVPGERACVYENVAVRVYNDYKNHVHLDTDEGNAAGIKGIVDGKLLI